MNAKPSAPPTELLIEAGRTERHCWAYLWRYRELHLHRRTPFNLLLRLFKCFGLLVFTTCHRFLIKVRGFCVQTALFWGSSSFLIIRTAFSRSKQPFFVPNEVS